MEAITKFLLPIVQTVNAYLSDYILIFLLVGVNVGVSIKCTVAFETPPQVVDQKPPIHPLAQAP